MRIKKSYLLILLVFISSFAIAQDTEDNVLAGVLQARCIPNNDCEYFENVDTCYVDCNNEALQRQREREALKARDEANNVINTNVGVTPSTNNNEEPGSGIGVMSVIFIAVFLVFVILLYSWIHKSHKKDTKKQPVRKPVARKPVVRPRVVRRRPVRRPVYGKVRSLPKKPRRRL